MKLGYIIRYSDKGVDGIMPVISVTAQFFFCSHGERLPKGTWHMATDDELKAARRALSLRSQAKKAKNIFVNALLEGANKP